jgi:hypothetical protein
MLQKSIHLITIFVLLVQAFACIQIRNICVLPTTLQTEILKSYPGYEIVNSDHLTEQHRTVFRKDHGNVCPGLVKVDFFGDGSLTFAVLLINRSLTVPKVQLIVATYHNEKGWEIIPLESTDASVVPVIWSEPSGKYEDAYNEKTIVAKYPVILLVGYESWVILYSWSGTEIEKIWLSD